MMICDHALRDVRIHIITSVHTRMIPINSIYRPTTKHDEFPEIQYTP